MAAPMRIGLSRYRINFKTVGSYGLLDKGCCQFNKAPLMQRHFGQPASKTHPHLMKEGEVTPGISREEFKQRRSVFVSNAVHLLKTVKDHIFIFPAASKVYMTYDIPYPFRQNTEFLYLCGFQEPDSVLVMHTEDTGYKSVLFVPKKDKEKELWDGPRSGDKGAQYLTGMSEAFNIEELEQYLVNYCKTNRDYAVWYNHSRVVNPRLHYNVIDEFLKQDGKKVIEDPSSLVQQLRLIKSESEIELMKRTTDIASQALVEVMKFSYPGVNESHLYAKMDFECRIRNAEILAYPPVVAGGNRANTIHYINNNQLVGPGELVLMDAGCEYHGYTSDITRTWPVSGKYTAAQRQLYLAILQVQEACIQLCTPENTLQEIYTAMMHLLAHQLLHLGIPPETVVGDENKLLKFTGELCPHHVGHYLGMDVHDTALASKRQKLVPGMVVTIEPGLYIQKDRQDVPEEYRGIGIRIEDDVLVTAAQPLVLSKACPKHPDDIEQILSQR